MTFVASDNRAVYIVSSASIVITDRQLCLCHSLFDLGAFCPSKLIAEHCKFVDLLYERKHFDRHQNAQLWRYPIKAPSGAAVITTTTNFALVNHNIYCPARRDWPLTPKHLVIPLPRIIWLGCQVLWGYCVCAVSLVGDAHKPC